MGKRDYRNAHRGDTRRTSRRRFLRAGAGAVALIPAAELLLRGSAQASSHLPKLDPSKSPADSLNYTHDATESQRAAPDHVCRTCRHYLGEPGAQWGGCNVFQGFLVNADGWCGAYIAKG